MCAPRLVSPQNYAWYDDRRSPLKLRPMVLRCGLSAPQRHSRTPTSGAWLGTVVPCFKTLFAVRHLLRRSGRWALLHRRGAVDTPPAE